MKDVVKACILGASLILMLSMSGAMAYEFGSKVMGDTDLNRALLPIPLIPQYRELVPPAGIGGYNPGDVAYLSQVAGFVSVGDVRLNAFDGHPAGSKVRIEDSDVGVGGLGVIFALPGAGWISSAVFGVAYSLAEAVYFDVSPPGPFGTPNAFPNIRITKVNSMPAGTIVMDSDSDFNAPLLAPFGALAAVSYFNINGNAGYDVEDPVYLDIGPIPGVTPVLGAVSIGDVRLSE